jgi:hypothetical protein
VGVGVPPVAAVGVPPFGGLAPPIGVNWPYSAAYLSLIPPGYATLMLGQQPYFYTTMLPPGCQPVLGGGGTAFVSAGVFYQPFFYQGQTVYVVVQR